MSGMIQNFHFIRPVALLLVPLAVLIWWMWQHRSDPLRGWRDQIDPDLMKALVVGNESSSRLPAQLILVAWIVAIIAIAGPTWRLEPSPFADDSTPLMILLKADISMETTDPTPSRLERARLKIIDLAEARKGQPLGLIAYSGSAHLVLPPTRDTSTVAEMAAEISPEIMPIKGDRLDLALREAGRILTNGKQGGSIVVFADSVDTDLALLESATKGLKFPVQFLAINVAGSSESASLEAAGRALRASIEPLDYEDKDVDAIVRRAARTPIAQGGEGGERWQESGYWLVPLVGFFVLNMFRRDESKEVLA
jgi:Ca-activated chloride channel family protein